MLFVVSEWWCKAAESVAWAKTVRECPKYFTGVDIAIACKYLSLWLLVITLRICVSTWARKRFSDLQLIEWEFLWELVVEFLSHVIITLILHELISWIICSHDFIAEHLSMASMQIWWGCLWTENNWATCYVLKAVTTGDTSVTAIHLAVALNRFILDEHVFDDWIELSFYYLLT